MNTNDAASADWEPVDRQPASELATWADLVLQQAIKHYRAWNRADVATRPLSEAPTADSSQPGGV